MPWLRSRTERSSGLTTWAIEWREAGRVRHRQLGPITEQEARYELAALSAGKGTRRVATQTTTPARAVAEYLRHLKVSGRRPGTIEHDQDKLKPLLDEWGERPLAQWSRAMLEALLESTRPVVTGPSLARGLPAPRLSLGRRSPERAWSSSRAA